MNLRPMSTDDSTIWEGCAKDELDILNEDSWTNVDDSWLIMVVRNAEGKITKVVCKIDPIGGTYYFIC